MDGNDTIRTSGDKLGLPDHPGPRTPKGTADEYRKEVESILAMHHLLVVADGGSHPKCKELVLHDLSKLPVVPADHPQHYRILESRTKWERENDVIREKHKTIMLEAWTTLAVALHQSTKAKHKVLHHSIYEKCRLDNYQTTQRSG